MNRKAFLGVLPAVAFSLWGQAPAVKTHLRVGDPAPDFTLRATTGQNFKLSDFKGRKNVVVAFFPAAFTGG
jgi:peroxiredoxin